jgi:hypothetical protein
LSRRGGRDSTTPAPAGQTSAAEPGATGYGSDPDLMKHYAAGELWPLLLTEAQRRSAGVLCDLIIPADDHSPSASAVGVVDFLDEWVSAPYPRQRQDLPLLIEGLAWLDAEATRRFAVDFAAATLDQQRALCDDICCAADASTAFARPAAFFARFRDLTAGGFYSTPLGFRDLKYIGNTPQVRFDGPPQDLLQRLGLNAGLT